MASQILNTSRSSLTRLASSVAVAHHHRQRRLIHLAAPLMMAKKKKAKTSAVDHVAVAAEKTKEEIDLMMARQKELEDDNILNSRSYLGKPLPGDVPWLPPNTKITRIPSDLEVMSEELEEEQRQCQNQYALRLKNRNPRNLEQMFLQLKPLGYELDENQRRFWYQVNFEKSGKYLTASVEHWSGETVINVSTKEAGLSDRLRSTNDVDAASAVGQLLARRCLESGIQWVDCKAVSNRSYKEDAFIAALAGHGITLREPEHIFPRTLRDQ